MFPEAKSREILRFERKENNCFPRDQYLSDFLYSRKFEDENSLNLAVTAVVGEHSRLTVQLPSGDIDFAMFPCSTSKLQEMRRYIPTECQSRKRKSRKHAIRTILFKNYSACFFLKAQ